MTTVYDMNTIDKIKKFKHMVNDKLIIIKRYNQYGEAVDINHVFGAVVELRAMIFTIQEFTELTEQFIEKHLIYEIGMTIDDLINFENTFYS